MEVLLLFVVVGGGGGNILIVALGEGEITELLEQATMLAIR